MLQVREGKSELMREVYLYSTITQDNYSLLSPRGVIHKE